MHGLPPNDLVQSHLWIVDAIAHKYWDKGPPGSDLLAAGALGLVEAAQRFEPARGMRFSTYAWNWVKGHVLGELRRCHVVPVPEHTARKACKDGEPISGVMVFGERHRAFGAAGEQEPAAERGMRLRALHFAVADLGDDSHRHVISRTLAGRTPEQIGKGMGLGAERVRQLLKEAQALLVEALS
jgi:RNA polymerase sigma factor (sigma-70 family)